MRRELLRAKIHRITVTERNVHYEGSLTLDADLIDAAKMVPYERIDVYNVNSGHRFSTYVIEGKRGSGACCVNGAAAHLADPGDLLIVASYSLMEDSEIKGHKPIIIVVDSRNRIKEIKAIEEERRTASQDA
ncbi:MAG: aspartate 1-decarboxylase [Acidobacteriota bacterium]